MSRPWGRPRCPARGVDAPCAWPGCCVEGEQLVIAGPYAVRYFRREQRLDIQQGRLIESWVWIEAVVNLVDAGRSA